MSSLTATLASIADLADQKVKQQQYQALLQQILASGNVQDCQELVTHGMQTHGIYVHPLTCQQWWTTCRWSLAVHCSRSCQKALDSSPTSRRSASQPCASCTRHHIRHTNLHSTLNKAQPRLVSYEEQLAGVRERLAELHEQQEEWSKAAHVLAGMDLESGMMTQSRWHTIKMHRQARGSWSQSTS